MDELDAKRIIEGTHPKALLQWVPFGKKGLQCAWIESSLIVHVGATLKSHEKMHLDCLENLSAMQVDQVIVLSYFLRSYLTGRQLVLRTSLGMVNEDAPLSAPSLNTLWPIATLFEREISELFGISFQPSGPQYVKSTYWDGFPLRKNFTLKLKIPSPIVEGPH